MNRMIFVNLPIKDLAVSRNFYTGLGFTVNEEFSDDQCACIVISDTIFVMLLSESRFKDFTNGGRVILDATETEVLNCISAESRAEVDDLFSRAIAAGGQPWRPLMEEGPMYGHSFADPDGHVWEVLHMEMAQ